ncbi:tetratricopeptide repeat protein 28-like [Oculina patagonica]
MATQYSAETHLSANPQSWIGIENVMTKENNCTCLYISYNAQTVLLWILKSTGVISFRKMTVDKNTLYKRLAQPAKNLDEFFAIMAKKFRSFGILPEEVCEDRSLNGVEPAESDCSLEENHAALRHAKDEENPEPSLTLFHEMLINPLSDLLQDHGIIIVPDRNLYRVPFAALLDGNGKYLSETFRIRIIPSMTTLKLIQDSPADYHSQTGALIVGDPDVGEVIYCGSTNRNFIPLPGARKEAEMIGRLLGVQPLLGQHETKQAVFQRIDSVSLIHFAAHGSAERGEIALAPPSSTTGIPLEDDYLLKMSDISKVQLRAKLVVLSCCHSGRGQIRAEGAVGIARAFLGSGARSVLVALWALEDSATKQFMSCFYHHLVRGESASESLYRAMKWMRDRKWWRGNKTPEVSEWAPFMLIGDNVTFDFKK